MKYTQKVQFYREVSIEAKNAAEANEKLQELIQTSEFHGDVQCDGYETFEDEPIPCPKCKGEYDEEGGECDFCKGELQVPFGTVYEPSQPTDSSRKVGH